MWFNDIILDYKDGYTMSNLKYDDRLKEEDSIVV